MSQNNVLVFEGDSPIVVSLIWQFILVASNTQITPPPKLSFEQIFKTIPSPPGIA